MDDLFDFVESEARKAAEIRKKNTPEPKRGSNAASAETLMVKTAATKAQNVVQSDAEQAVFSVGALARKIRFLVEENFGRIAVEGEVSNLKIAASGHCYLRLKDNEAVLNATIWRTALQRLPVQPEEGMQVVAYGTLTTYSARSEYQMTIDRLEPAGLGALMQILEQRKAKMAAEGLFDESRKKPLPFLPQTIGIITSPTGAVIDDMLHRIAARCPRHVLLWPVQVQGETAAAQIAAAIEGFNALDGSQGIPRPDVLIVARGGGSLEDLWAFNEEVVVRAAAASAIPLISGVGHEPDVTLIDYAADKRAPTPTAAAEMAVPVRADLLAGLNYRQNQLYRALRQELNLKKQLLKTLRHRLPHPQRELQQLRLRLDDKAQQLEKAIRQALLWRKSRLPQQQQLHTTLMRLLKQRKQATQQAQQLLQSYSPLGPLQRGYAYVTNTQGQVVKSAQTTETDITLHFADGKRGAKLNPKS